jgi:hypothetical protein
VYSVALTESGWTNDDVAVKWLRHSFAPQAREKQPDINKPILLVYDGHGSHVTDAFLDEAEQWNIRLYLLPPKTTHRLQPLDVGCFGPVKTAWLDRATVVASTTQRGIPRADLVNEFLDVRNKSMTEGVVRRGWRESGLVPFNPNKFTSADYAPAQATSSVLYLPESFTASLSSVYTRTVAFRSSQLSAAFGDSEEDEQDEVVGASPEIPADEFDDSLMDVDDDEEQQMDVDDLFGLPLSASSSPPPSENPPPSHAVAQAMEDEPERNILSELPTPATPRSSTPSLPPPHTFQPSDLDWSIPVITPPRIRAGATVLERLNAVSQYCNRLEAIAREESHLRQTAVSQRDLLAGELQAVRGQLEAQLAAKKRTRKKTRKHEGGWLNSPVNNQLRADEQAEADAATQQQQDNDARLAEEDRQKELEWAAMRDDPTLRFRGGLKGVKYKKPALRDLCGILELPTARTLTVAQYKKSIMQKIASSPDLQIDPRFMDIDWDGTGRGRGRHRRDEVPQEDDDDDDDDDDEENGDEAPIEQSGACFFAVPLYQQTLTHAIPLDSTATPPVTPVHDASLPSSTVPPRTSAPRPRPARRNARALAGSLAPSPTPAAST